MKYLVDANVLSEPTKVTQNPHVIAWLRAHEQEIAVDPVVVGELRFGIVPLPKGRRRTRLEEWFDAGVRRLHCLAWEAECGLRWADLLARLRHRGQAMPVKESLIATTALVHGLTMVTRNRSDFGKTGVNVIDPFEA